MAKWYYLKGEERLGPLDQPAFDELVRQGAIAPETLVWRDGMADWQPYGQAGQVPSAEQMAGDHVACVECGGVLLKEDVISFRGNFVCANCKPIFMAKITQGVERTSELNYAGFWIRFGAKFLDWLIVGIPMEFLRYSLFGMESLWSPETNAGGVAFRSIQLVSSYLLHLAVDLEVWRHFGETGAESSSGYG